MSPSRPERTATGADRTVPGAERTAPGVDRTTTRAARTATRTERTTARTADTAAPELRQLADRLRHLRTEAGLSLEALSARTHRGTTSWARYLCGTALPPRGAVEELCRAAGAQAHEVLALWELAEAEWSGRAGRARDAAPDAAAPRAEHRRPKAALTLASAAAALAATLTLALTLTTTGGDARPTPPPSAAPGCTGRTCEGQDPVRMGCGGADMVTTLATHTAGDRRVELRYGRPCAAVWARAAHLRKGDRVDVTLPGRPPKQVVAQGGPRYAATPMTAGDPSRATVCLTPADGSRRCFTAGDES
ncbi:helix-turn-helix domain-containing protein [Streptomyces mesophilus]|uniref:helix-turn-helix domain-containing protein n=1 Tax=Streptomyces mesophilus TaxID=1775132 RepID=UPI003324BA06